LGSRSVAINRFGNVMVVASRAGLSPSLRTHSAAGSCLELLELSRRILRFHRSIAVRLKRLNYQHLLYFHAVVRTGSLTRASEELALSPPTISAQLRALEQRLGARVLTQNGRTLRPTDVGRLVYGYADDIFGIGRELLETVEQRPSERPL